MLPIRKALLAFYLWLPAQVGIYHRLPYTLYNNCLRSSLLHPLSQRTINHIPATDDCFFELSRKYRYKDQTMRIYAGSEYNGRLNHALLVGSYPKGSNFPLTFYEHKDFKGKELGHFLCTAVGEPLLISAAFKSKLEAHNVTGWKSYPIVLVDREGKEITSPKYFGFSITGRCGRRNMFQSNGVTYHTEGIQLGPATWDGSDIFIETTHKIRGMYISKRVAELFLTQDQLAVTPISQAAVTPLLYDLERGL